jgi:hypothetical protein
MPTVRLAFQYRRPQLFEPEPQEVVGREQHVTVSGATPLREEMACRRLRPGLRKMAQRLGAQRAHGMVQ